MNYIGSKFSILEYIDETINDFVKPKDKNLHYVIFSQEQEPLENILKRKVII